MTENQINQLIKEGAKCRVYFKQFDRTPMFGKFVALKDHEEISKKGMVRFVSVSRLDSFEVDGHVMHTRIYSINSFSDFTKF